MGSPNHMEKRRQSAATFGSVKCPTPTPAESAWSKKPRPNVQSGKHHQATVQRSSPRGKGDTRVRKRVGQAVEERGQVSCTVNGVKMQEAAQKKAETAISKYCARFHERTM